MEDFGRQHVVATNDQCNRPICLLADGRHGKWPIAVAFTMHVIPVPALLQACFETGVY